MRLQCYELIFTHPHPRQMIIGYRTALPFPSCKKENTELKADTKRIKDPITILATKGGHTNCSKFWCKFLFS